MREKNINAVPSNRAPGEFDLILGEWASWKFSGASGPLGYPQEAPFTRNSARGGQGNYVPDVDRAARCSLVDEAITSVGGINEGILRSVYLYPRGVDVAAKRYGISHRTVYRWLDEARFVVWRVYSDLVANKGRVMA